MCISYILFILLLLCLMVNIISVIFDIAIVCVCMWRGVTVSTIKRKAAKSFIVVFFFLFCFHKVCTILLYNIRWSNKHIRLKVFRFFLFFFSVFNIFNICFFAVSIWYNNVITHVYSSCIFHCLLYEYNIYI
jgi:hypothetical protein